MDRHRRRRAAAAAADRGRWSAATARSRSSRSIGGSPAARAGLRAEDLIVAIDGVPVRGVDDLQRLLDAERIGVGVALSVVREGEPREVTLRPEELSSR